mgnify:CR=1 FL=1
MVVWLRFDWGVCCNSPPIAAVALGGWYHSITPLLQRWLGVFDWVWVLGVWRWFCLNFIKIMKRSESQSRSQPAVAYGLAQSYPVCCGAQIIGGHAAFQRGRIAPMAQASSTSGGNAALDFNIFWKCFFKFTKKIFSQVWKLPFVKTICFGTSFFEKVLKVFVFWFDQ